MLGPGLHRTLAPSFPPDFLYHLDLLDFGGLLKDASSLGSCISLGSWAPVTPCPVHPEVLDFLGPWLLQDQRLSLRSCDPSCQLIVPDTDVTLSTLDRGLLLPGALDTLGTRVTLGTLAFPVHPGSRLLLEGPESLRVL